MIPSKKTARSGVYRLVRPLLLLTGPLSQPIAEQFVEFALSAEASKSCGPMGGYRPNSRMSMPGNFVASLYRRWQLESLGVKLLSPILGPMLISLPGSTLAFVAGTALTQDPLLRQKIAGDNTKPDILLTDLNTELRQTLLPGDALVLSSDKDWE